MSKKACPTCGAYLRDDDKVCYVCGEVVPAEKQETVPVEESTEPETEHALAMDETQDDSYDEYIEEQPSEDSYNFSDDKKDKPKMSTVKKTVIICAVLVALAAVIATGVCVCFANGFFDNNEKESYTIYFDKPSSDVNLIDAQGTVYNWGADVDIVYTLDDKEEKQHCKMSEEHDTLWVYELPKGAENVYFTQTTGSNIRTETLSEPLANMVYYVSDILLDDDLQLKVKSCPIGEFDNLGVNKEIPTEAPTEVVTETVKATQATEEEKETTRPVVESTAPAEPYVVNIPSSWQEGTTVVQKDNCTTYYETYNYKTYSTGNLLSIYVVDANDTSYSEMNVKKIITSADGTKKIVAVTPTDIQFADTDETAMTNYTNLSGYTNNVINSISAN